MLKDLPEDATGVGKVEPEPESLESEAARSLRL